MNRLVLAAMLLAACDDDGGGPPSCEQMARKAAKHGLIDDDRDEIDDLAHECKREDWPARFRSCLAKVRSEREANECEEMMPRKVDDREPKKSEAEVNLDRIRKAAKVAFDMDGKFPVGSVGATPGASCCDSGRSDRKCEPDASLWQGPLWQQLDFEVTEPHYFRYAYDSTGEAFTAKAIGDLDCDAAEVEYVLEGVVDNGAPVFDLTRPARAD